tara:strand:+ start:380 stop:970 length:591 start_codon:yes stop_codon:yes gene_type:complete
MGLDIHATNNLTKIPKEDIPYGVEPYNDKFYQWEQDMDVYLRYIDRSNGEGENYWSKHSDPFETGYYMLDGSDYHTFRAGSYTYYSNWRKMLALTMGFDDMEDVWSLDPYDATVPFIELLNFSDSSGRIGPLVSAELYNDFVSMEEKVFEFIDRMSYGVVSGQKLRLGEVSDFKELYEDWKYAFELAKEGGEVMLM